MTINETGINMVIIITAAALVLIIIMVLVLLSGKKKKKAAGSSSENKFVPVYPSAVHASFGVISENSPIDGSVETTILAQDGETTLLKRNVYGGTLLRTRTHERVRIDREEFKVGRDGNEVAYCITDNTSVGRVHAKFTVHSGRTFLVDNVSKNGTFLNGSRCFPYQEYPLENGDQIIFSDEEFLYQS